MPESTTEENATTTGDALRDPTTQTAAEDSSGDESAAPDVIDRTDAEVTDRDDAEVVLQGSDPELAELAELDDAEPDESEVGNAESEPDTAEPDTAESDTAETSADDALVSGEALLVQEGEIAGDYLEQLLDILDYDGDIDLDVEGSRAIVAIVGANDLDPLVGPRGVTLDALQELTRLTVAQQTGVRTRLMLDVGGYRAGRRTELSELAATSVSRVIDNGETLRMSPMNAFERKIVHDVVTATDGVRSESEGEDPDRRVVILPDR